MTQNGKCFSHKSELDNPINDRLELEIYLIGTQICPDFHRLILKVLTTKMQKVKNTKIYKIFILLLNFVILLFRAFVVN